MNKRIKILIVVLMAGGCIGYGISNSIQKFADGDAYGGMFQVLAVMIVTPIFGLLILEQLRPHGK